MKFINKRMVVVLNKLIVEMSGGTAFSGTNIRSGQSLSFLEHISVNSLFGQPLYPTIYHQAAAYMFHIIKSHLFIDGNKRTGLSTAITFLEWNDIYMKPLDEETAFDFVMSIAAGVNDADIVIPRIALWLENLAGSFQLSVISNR